MLQFGNAAQIVKSCINLIFLGVLVASMVTFGLLERPTEMGLSIVACAVCLAFVNLDRFERFKGAGFEAELKKAVEEAYATTTELKSLAEPFLHQGANVKSGVCLT